MSIMEHKVIVPKKLKKKLLEELHKDHPGISRMKSVARSYIWWPGLDKAIEEVVKSCTSCQAVKHSKCSYKNLFSEDENTDCFGI